MEKIDKILETTDKIYQKQQQSDTFFHDIQDKLLVLCDRIEKTKDEQRDQDKRVAVIERTVKQHNMLLFVLLIIFILLM